MAGYLGGHSLFIQNNYVAHEHASWQSAFKAIAPYLKPAAIEQQSLNLKTAVVTAIESFMVDGESEIELDQFGFYIAYSSSMRFLFGYVPPMREVEMVRKKADGIFSHLDNTRKVSRMGAYLEEVSQQVQNHGEFHASPNSIYSA